MTLEVDAALGGSWEELGRRIKAAGGEDASGARRVYANLLARREYERVARALKISVPDAMALRGVFVREFGEPEGVAA